MKEENYRTMVSPGVALDINGAFTTGRIAYTLTGAYDSSSSGSVNDISVFHLLLGLVSWRATPQLTLTVSDVLTRNDTPQQADRLELRRRRTPFTSNTFSALSDYRIGRIATTGLYQLSTFSDETADTTSHTVGATIGTNLDPTTSITGGYTYLTSHTSSTASSTSTAIASTTSGHTGTASISRQLNVRTSAGLSGSYSIRSSSGPGSAAISPGFGAFGTESFGLGTSGSYTLWTVDVFDSYTSGPLALTGSLGYSRLTQGSHSFNAVFSLSTLSYSLAKALASVAFDSGFSETFTQGQNFGVVQTRGVTVSFAYPLTPFLASRASGFYRQDEGTGVVSGTSGARSDTWGAILTMTYQLTRNISLVLDYRHTEATGQGPAAFGQTSSPGYAENRITLSLAAAF